MQDRTNTPTRTALILTYAALLIGHQANPQAQQNAFNCW